MSKLQKVYVAVMAVICAVGVISVAFFNSKPYVYPSGSVIDEEYVKALSWNYVKENGFKLGFYMAAIPITLLIYTVMYRLKGIYMGKRAKLIYVLLPTVIILGLFAFLPGMIRVGLGKPGAAVEIVTGKKTGHDRKGGTSYYLAFDGGKVEVPDNWYNRYNIGDKLVVVRSGGVPLEVQQPEVFTISDDLS